MAPSTFAMDYLNNVQIAKSSVAPKPKKKTEDRGKSFRVIQGANGKSNVLSKSSFIGGVVCIVIFMTLLVFSVFLTARASNVKYNINKLTYETNRIENEISLVNTKIEAANSMNAISQFASEELGLGAANVDQYAVISNSDVPDNLSIQIKDRIFG